MTVWTHMPSVPQVQEPTMAILLQAVKANLEQLKPLLTPATATSQPTRAKLWFVAP